ncbi:hypothetical protein KOR34_23580 [Posidoniimonas corsicana]|uniref:DUF3891 domain-containing protein n=1 Tax=Posidoniimonas corsicana TaxID=1938618 RepID=A0A5C5VFF7_9BACT|nr:DUF3891 family protein [Posidoniimonas corsicana]TWT37408.1 hypothetical protein KOR34_23580 [Posidoniimonas corsicana]
MIRRDAPRSGQADHWLLIPQRAHARLSYELAAAWGNAVVPPLLSGLESARGELLQAVRTHDEGWAEWESAPAIDPDHQRPYGFTEMPPADAQRLWTHSIEACRQIGPLAGWIVSGHFIHLQSKHDHDYDQWAPWLAQQHSHQQAWLDEWRAQDPGHTPEVARRSLFYLQTFDWLSLWLCCRAPLGAHDPDETLELSASRFEFGPFHWTAAAGRATATPWPFAEPQLDLSVDALRVPVGRYATSEQLLAAAQTAKLDWRLCEQP